MSPKSASKSAHRAPFRLEKNKPVTGNDLNRFRAAYELSVSEARNILGLSNGAWLRHTGVGKRSVMLQDPGLALLLRYYSERPDRVPVPRYPTPDEVLPYVRGNSLYLMANLLGRGAPAGWRWVKQNARFGPVVKRLAKLFVEEAKAGNHDWWESHVVNAEAKARGVPDALSTRRWLEPTKRKPKTTKKEVASRTDDGIPEAESL
jgi:hypothetical protein